MVRSVSLRILRIAFDGNDHVQGGNHTNDLPTPAISREGEASTAPPGHPWALWLQKPHTLLETDRLRHRKFFLFFPGILDDILVWSGDPGAKYRFKVIMIGASGRALCPESWFQERRPFLGRRSPSAKFPAHFQLSSMAKIVKNVKGAQAI